MKRRLLLTPTQTKQLLKLLSEAVPVGTAAEAIGLAPRTLRSWLQRAEGGDADVELTALAAAVSRARAQGRIALIRRIQAATRRDWRAACFLLSRASPEEFGVRAMEANFPPAPPANVSYSYEQEHSNGQRE